MWFIPTALQETRILNVEWAILPLFIIFVATSKLATAMKVLPWTVRQLCVMFIKIVLPISSAESAKKERSWLRSSRISNWWSWSCAFAELQNYKSSCSTLSQVSTDWTVPTTVLKTSLYSLLRFGNASWWYSHAATNYSASLALVVLYFNCRSVWSGSRSS